MNQLRIFMLAPLMTAAALCTGLAAGAEGSDLAVVRPLQQRATTAQDVDDALSIRGHPQSLLLKAGETALFRVTGVRGNGSQRVFYQWRRNGSDIQGADRPWLKLDQIARTDDGSRFTVLVICGPASVESKPGALRVVSAPTAFSDD